MDPWSVYGGRVNSGSRPKMGACKLQSYSGANAEALMYIKSPSFNKDRNSFFETTVAMSEAEQSHVYFGHGSFGDSMFTPNGIGFASISEQLYAFVKKPTETYIMSIPDVDQWQEQIYRFEHDNDNRMLRFYINGTLRAEMSDPGVSSATIGMLYRIQNSQAFGSQMNTGSMSIGIE
jgi:hypothetical protein